VHTRRTAGCQVNRTAETLPSSAHRSDGAAAAAAAAQQLCRNGPASSSASASASVVLWPQAPSPGITRWYHTDSAHLQNGHVARRQLERGQYRRAVQGAAGLGRVRAGGGELPKERGVGSGRREQGRLQRSQQPLQQPQANVGRHATGARGKVRCLQLGVESGDLGPGLGVQGCERGRCLAHALTQRHHSQGHPRGAIRRQRAQLDRGRRDLCEQASE
jgi:hypothetical protein